MVFKLVERFVTPQKAHIKPLTGFPKSGHESIYSAHLVNEQGVVILADKIINVMETIEAILSEVDKLQPDQKRRLLHQLVDRMLTAPTPELSVKTNFDKYAGIGRGVWEVDAQTYIDESRTDERF